MENKLFNRLSEGSLTPHFTFSEFACKDGTAVPIADREKVLLLAQNLEVLRSYFKQPITINSGYRTLRYNKKVGGASKSYHMRAMAVDITVKGFTPLQVWRQIANLQDAGLMLQGGLFLYKTFVHYDIRGYSVRQIMPH